MAHRAVLNMTLHVFMLRLRNFSSLVGYVNVNNTEWFLLLVLNEPIDTKGRVNEACGFWIIHEHHDWKQERMISCWKLAIHATGAIITPRF